MNYSMYFYALIKIILIMKAIVNVSKFNQYSKYNGRTFEVKEILPNLISLNIEGSVIDFTHQEIIVVDIDLIYQQIVKPVTRSSTPQEWILKTKFEQYIKTNNIQIS